MQGVSPGGRLCRSRMVRTFCLLRGHKTPLSHPRRGDSPQPPLLRSFYFEAEKGEAPEGIFLHRLILLPPAQNNP